MKEIDVKNQKRLSLGRCFELVLSGVQFRLFRAAITVAIVALAVAFLMTMLTESLSAQRVAAAIEDEIAPREMLLYWVDRVTNPMTPADLTDELAGIEPQGPRWQEFENWGDLDEAQLAALQKVAQAEQDYRRFFAALDEGEIRPLVGRARGTAIFQHLQDADNWQMFAEQLPKSGSQLPTDIATFESFLADWKETQPMREAIIAGHLAAVDKAKALMGDTTPTSFLATADADRIRALETYGYVLPESSLAVIREQAALVRDARMIERTLMVGTLKSRLAGELNMDSTDVTAANLFDQVRDESGATWLLEQIAYLQARPQELAEKLAEKQQTLREQDETLASLETDIADAQAALTRLNEQTNPPADTLAEARQKLATLETQQDAAAGKRSELQGEVAAIQTSLTKALGEAKAVESFAVEVDRMQDVATYRREQDRLAAVEQTIRESDVATDGEGWMGFSTRTLWLMIVSFVVCVVGIANAMLMSVTERFREIATMKCLGATDGFIMINFILESCMQGIAGGLIGTILGLALGLLRSWTGYGLMALSHFPWSSVLAVGGISLVMGVMLSAIAAVYPAWVAARLAPMEAMRIE